MVPVIIVHFMGSMIHLSVGRLEIDWGKNSAFNDHSALFQATDVANVPYYYVDPETPYKDDSSDDEYNVITEMKRGLSKPLSQVVDRINLLGHTLECAHHEFQFLSRLNEFDAEKFGFSQLAEALATVDVSSISADYGDGGEDFGEFFRRYIYDRVGLQRIVGDPHYVRFNIGTAMENLSAYTVLQLLAQNPSARDLPVTWQFADVEDGGWAERREFARPLDPTNRFLIVTEGSSDAGILRHALKLLKPHVSDFFYFVDMDEGYPFTGTGNLHNFAKGLISISIQNDVIILYDNDAAGVFSFSRTAGLNVPANMRILRLPDLPEFLEFRTVGPSGEHHANINGRAAAIECYLDVGPEALVRWNNFNKGTGFYHGELVGKADVVKRFHSLTHPVESYDFSKITAVIEMIIGACVGMRESGKLARFQL